MFELLNTCILFCAFLNSGLFRMQAFAFARRLNIFFEMKNFENTISDRGLMTQCFSYTQLCRRWNVRGCVSDIRTAGLTSKMLYVQENAGLCRILMEDEMS